MSSIQDVVDFDSAVFGFYIEYGKPGTAQEIADFSGMPIGRVRKVINESKYRSDTTSVESPVQERNYGGVRCYRRVNAYIPSRGMLRDRILQSRG